MPTTNEPDEVSPAGSQWPQGSDSPHSSPILSGLDPSTLPVPSPACSDCPASIWYGAVSELRCFCKMFNRHVWGTEEFDLGRDPVMACDGREMAIEQMMAKLEEAAEG